MSSASKVTITIIVAGTNEPSNADYLAERMMEGMRSSQPDIMLRKYRLKDMTLNHFTLEHYATDHADDDFPILQKAVQEAHAVVIASPIWNFSVPAHLKNLIDRMGSFGLDEKTRSVGTMSGKPAYLIFTGGSPSVTWPLYRRTLSHVSVGLQYFGCAVVGTHFEGRCTLGRGKFGLVVDKRPATLAAMIEKGKAFAELVKKFKTTGNLPLQYRIKRSIVSAGQKVRRRLGW
ncbi:MAG: NAD(P)H-dependent oxidoreductase [Candidatus Peribacteraceae bacterium]|nr:NAD(P)H-dependent oxidoreductase [Candidatus Peribacteraceae bacterium]